MNVGVAILGGLIGGTAMVGVLYSAIWMLPRQMKMNFLLIVGTMLVPVGASAYAVGLMLHLMMSTAFGLIHGGLIEAIGVTSAGEGAVYGALFGLGHAVIAGVALGMMPLLHPRMRPEQPKLVPAFGAGAEPEEELLDPPGFFGMNYPAMTVRGFFMLHVMFGAIVGLLYGAWA